MPRLHCMAVRSPALALLVFISTASVMLTGQADDTTLHEFARRYAAAWSSQDPEALDATGLILQSKGHYDEAEFLRQVGDENRQ